MGQSAEQTRAADAERPGCRATGRASRPRSGGSPGLGGAALGVQWPDRVTRQVYVGRQRCQHLGDALERYAISISTTPGARRTVGRPVTAATITPRLSAALDSAWARIRELHPDVPEVVITMGSGSAMTRWSTGQLLGHFAASAGRRWPPRLSSTRQWAAGPYKDHPKRGRDRRTREATK